jgi:hypothetical protein
VYTIGFIDANGEAPQSSDVFWTIISPHTVLVGALDLHIQRSKDQVFFCGKFCGKTKQQILVNPGIFKYIPANTPAVTF